MHVVARGMTSKAEAEALADELRLFLEQHQERHREVVVGPSPYNVLSTRGLQEYYDDPIGDMMSGIVRGFRAGWAARKSQFARRSDRCRKQR